MPDQNRFSPLQMRVRRHGSIARLFRTIHQRAAQLGNFLPQLIDGSAHVQPQIGRDLLIAAASAVQLVSQFRRSTRPVASRQNDERPPLPSSSRNAGDAAACSPICSSPCRMLISSSADNTPALFNARACALLAASSYCSSRRSNPNDRCQRSKSGSSGCRNLPDHIFIVRPPHAGTRARTGRQSQECG